MPAPPVAYDPTQNMLQAIFNADVAAGGTSYWIDRILARPFLSGDSTSLYTRGRGLYMYTHTPGTLGFAGGYAYRERPTGASQNLYTITISGATLTETTAQRMQYPSYYTAAFTATGLNVTEKKFITDNNVAVTSLTITNTGGASTTRTLTASSPIATTASGVRAHRHGVRPVRPDHAAAPAQRRQLHGQRHQPDPQHHARRGRVGHLQGAGGRAHRRAARVAAPTTPATATSTPTPPG